MNSASSRKKLQNFVIFRLLPSQLPRSVIYFSFMISFLSIILVNPQASEFIWPNSLRRLWIDNVTYFIDPLLIHLFGLILCIAVAWNYIEHTRPNESTITKLFTSIFPPLCLILLSYLLERLILKPAFSYPRPSIETQALSNPWITGLIERIFHFEIGETIGDAPSGFTSRQLVLCYTSIWLAGQKYPTVEPHNVKKSGYIIPTITRRLIYGLSIAGVVAVMFSRFYRANHSFFGVCLAVSVATFLFWGFLVIVYVISGKDAIRSRSVLAETFGAYIPFTLVLVSYTDKSADPKALLLLFGLILFVFAATYVFTQPIIVRK